MPNARAGARASSRRVQVAVLSNLKSADVFIPVIPKSAPRPRFSGRAYNDSKYTAWKLNFRAFVSEWWVRPPLDQVTVMVVHFYGPEQGDLDNKLKSCLDSLTGLVIIDDNVKVVPHIAMRWFKRSKADSHIYLKVCWLEQ